MEIIESPLYRASFDTSMTCLSISRNWYQRLTSPPRRICMVDLLDAGTVDGTLNALGAGVQLHKTLAAIQGDTMQLFAWRDQDNTAQLLLVDYAPEELEQEPLARKRERSTGSEAGSPQERNASEKSDAREYSLLAAIGCGVLKLDEQGRILFANAATSRLLGWTDERILNRRLYERLHHSHADGKPRTIDECPVFHALASGQEQRVDSEVFWCADNSCIAVDYCVTPLLEDEKITGAVLVFQEIGQRQQHSQQHEQALFTLQQQAASLLIERQHLRSELESCGQYGALVGSSLAQQRTMAQIAAVAPLPSSVLIHGEAGTGKEITARALHNSSARSESAFIKLNCAALAATLSVSDFERVLFGDTSDNSQPGCLQKASGGTLYLEAVDRIPLALQSRVLRVLQQHSYEYANDTQSRPADVRIIAATCSDLQQASLNGAFDEALYYELSVCTISLAPLRARAQDIAPLAQHFLQQGCLSAGRDALTLSKHQIDALNAYTWPGNINELKNTIERALIVSPCSRLQLELAMPELQTSRHGGDALKADDNGFLTDAQFRELEKANLHKALRHCGWKIAGKDGTAAQLGLKPSTLAYRMKLFALEKNGEPA